MTRAQLHHPRASTRVTLLLSESNVIKFCKICIHMEDIGLDVRWITCNDALFCETCVAMLNHLTNNKRKIM